MYVYVKEGKKRESKRSRNNATCKLKSMPSLPVSRFRLQARSPYQRLLAHVDVYLLMYMLILILVHLCYT